METKKSKFGIFLLFSILFLSMVNGVFAAKTLTELLSTDNLVGLFKNMEWMNWAIYIALIFLVGNILTQVLGGSKGAKMGSYLVSFMGITGFMWVLINNDVMPIHLMLWVAEIFVLIFVGALIKVSFAISKGKDGAIGKLKWFGLFFGLMILNQFNGMLMSFREGFASNLGPSLVISQDSTLYQVAETLHFVDLPIQLILGILLIWVFFSLIGESGAARDVKQGPLGQYIKKSREESQKHSSRMKLVLEIKDLYKQLKGIK